MAQDQWEDVPSQNDEWQDVPSSTKKLGLVQQLKSFPSTVSDVVGGTSHPIDELKNLYQNVKAHPVDTFLQGAKDLAMAPVNAAYQATHHPIDTATALTGGPQFQEGYDKGNYGEMAGALVGGAVNAYGVAKGVQSASSNARSLSESSARMLNNLGVYSGPTDDTVARAFRNPDTGKLKPIARTGARLAGAGIGHYVAGPYGAAAGAIYGPEALSGIIPEMPESPPYEVSAPPAKIGRSVVFQAERPQTSPAIPSSAAPTPAQEFAARQAANNPYAPPPAPSMPKPLRPLVGSEGDWNAYDQQMGILRPEASDAGTYHAARGSANKKVNLQQRIGKRIVSDPYSPTR